MSTTPDGRAPALRFALTYAVLAAAWVVGSDLLVLWFGDGTPSATLASASKGLLFVAVTSGIVFHAMKRVLSRVQAVQAALVASEERWRFALEGTGDGVWDWDVPTGRVHLSRRWKEQLGYRENELGDDLSEWESRVHPDDLPVCRALLQSHFRGEIPYYEVEHRVRHRDGHWVWILDRGKVIERAPDGSPRRMLGTHRDVTEARAAREALRTSEARLRTMYESGMIGVLYWDMAGGITDANDTFLETVGYTREDLAAGRVSWAAMTPPEYKAADDYALEELKHRGLDTPYEKEYVRKDGTRVSILVGAATLDDTRHAGIAFVLDISKRRAAENERRRLDEQRQLALDAARLGWWHYDPRTRVATYDQRYCEIFGVTGSSRPNDEILERLHPDDLPGVWAKVEAALDPADPQPYAAEYRIRLPLGVERWIEAHGIATFEGEGAERRAVSLVGTVADITERRLAEQRLRDSEERLRIALDAAQLGTFEFDPVSGLCRWDAQRAPAWGLAPDAAVHFSLAFDRLHEEDRERVARQLDEAIAPDAGGDYDVEYRMVWPDGSVHWTNARGRVYFDGAGAARRAVRMIGVEADITARKNAERELRLWADAFRHCAHGIAIGDPNGNSVRVANRAFAEQHGCSPEELAGRPILALCDPAEHDQIRAWIREADRVGQVRFESTRVRSDGSTFPVQLDLVSVRGADGQVLYRVATAQDITERKRWTDALQASEQRLRRAEEIAKVGHYHADLVTGQTIWSAELYRIFGVDPAHWRVTPETFLEIVHPDDREEFQRQREVAYRGEEARFAFRIVRPDGETRWVAGIGLAELGADGTPVARYGILQDVTLLHEAERELREKNEELERFTYMISHDLKSPLVTFQVFLGYLEADIAAGQHDNVGKDLAFMRGAAHKMGRLLEDLLEMSRVGRLANPPECAGWRALAGEALEAVAGRIAQRGIAVELAGEDLELKGDRARLVEVWQNLLENAAKFMHDRPEPRIVVGREAHGADSVFFVRDNGPGVDPRYHDRIFGLFEKLSVDADGTGLGLALVRRIVELYGGRVWLESDGAGAGSCFRFTLPDAVRAAASREVS